MDSNNAFLSTAHSLADLAGEIARACFRQPMSMSLKSTCSPVTQADLAIERCLRDYLQTHWPKHGVLGEEMADYPSACEFTWVIDPIDGTSSFACGKPSFCTLIALLFRGIPIIGIIDQAITGERWSAMAGKGAFYNGTRLATRPCVGSADFIRLNCTTPLMFNPAQRQQFDAVRGIASVTSFGGDGYAYGLLASGHIDVIMEADLQFYDVAALIPIIEGAGMCISTWEGKAIDAANFDGTVLAARDKVLHERVLALIRLNPSW